MQSKQASVWYAHTKRTLRRSLRGLVPPAMEKVISRKKTVARKPFLTLARDGRPFEVGDDPLRLQFINGHPLVEFPLEKVMYSGGIRYNGEEHPFVRFFIEGVEAMRRYYANHQPRDICEQHFLPPASNKNATVPAAIWREMADGVVSYSLNGEHGLSGEHGTKLFGPVTEQKILLEADKLNRLKKSFDAKGLDYNGKFLQGHMVIDNDGEWAVLPTDGQHRLALMAHFGIRTAIIRLKPTPMRIIHERDVEHFPMVRLGLVTTDEASAILRSYTQPFDKPGLYDPVG